MAERMSRTRKGRFGSETSTNSECISVYGETDPRRFAAHHQENPNRPCSTTRSVASLRGHTKRCAFWPDRGWRGRPAAPPRPPLIYRFLISCVTAHAFSPRLDVLHG